MKLSIGIDEVKKSYIMSLIKYRSINLDVLNEARKLKKTKNKWPADKWKDLYGEAIACNIEAKNLQEAFLKAAKEYHLESTDFVIYDILYQ